MNCLRYAQLGIFFLLAGCDTSSTSSIGKPRSATPQVTFDALLESDPYACKGTFTTKHDVDGTFTTSLSSQTGEATGTAMFAWGEHTLLAKVKLFAESGALQSLGTLTFDGVTFDGNGALSDNEKSKLRALIDTHGLDDIAPLLGVELACLERSNVSTVGCGIVQMRAVRDAWEQAQTTAKTHQTQTMNNACFEPSDTMCTDAVEGFTDTDPAFDFTMTIPSTENPELRMAALMLPWQLLVKYDADVPKLDAMLSRASCTLVDDEHPEEGESLPEEISIDDEPHSVGLDTDFPVPVIGMFQPFDGEGADDEVGDGLHSLRPCGAMCSGTCGPDCPTNNCTTSYGGYCQQSAGKWARNAWMRKVCGSHAGCRAHDGCYDGCNTTHGCGTWGATTCRRGCDAVCLADYCPGCAIAPITCNSWTCNCISWMNGNPPYDVYSTYWHFLYQIENCDDNSVCTTDGCANNTCSHTQIVCNDNNLCTNDSCNAVNGCVYTNKCQPGETCDPQVGNCIPPDPCAQCLAPNVCINGVCTVSTPNQCVQASMCSSYPCAVASCVNGACSYTPKCTGTQTCNMQTGDCSNTTPTCSTSCDDGMSCTTDSCMNGACSHVMNCDFGMTCDPTTGACVTPTSSQCSNATTCPQAPYPDCAEATCTNGACGFQPKSSCGLSGYGCSASAGCVECTKKCTVATGLTAQCYTDIMGCQ